jgi:hypothetical protein
VGAQAPGRPNRAGNARPGGNLSAWFRDFVVNVAQLELDGSYRCLGRSLVVCHSSHLSLRVVRYAEAVELFGVAFQLKHVVAPERQCWKLRGMRASDAVRWSSSRLLSMASPAM